MKFALLSTITIHFLATSSSTSAIEAATHVILGTDLMSGDEAASPIALSDAADKASNDALAAASLPEYCHYDPDFTCYKKGVPRCCTRARNKCPKKQSGCDVGSRSPIPSPIRGDIDQGDYCNANKEVCVNGYSCVRGICQTRDTGVINPGGSCNVNKDVCVNGYSCAGQGICRKRDARRAIRPGDYCNASSDVCVDGYSCVGGICQSSGVGPGGWCNSSSDVCVNGYSCVNGKCAVKTPGNIPNGGDCTNSKDGCMDGLFCKPSPYIGSDRWMCQP